MILRLFFCLLLLVTIQTHSVCQLNFSAEINGGLIYLDYNKSKEDFFGFFQGTAGKTEAQVYAHYQIHTNINASWGFGYMHVFLLDVWKTYMYSDYSHISYLASKLSVDFKYRRWPELHLGVSNYLLAHEKKKHRLQQRYFANIDFGTKIKLSSHSKLTITSPFTIFPMYHGGPIGITNRSGSTGLFKPWIEMNGLVLGWQYMFLE